MKTITNPFLIFVLTLASVVFTAAQPTLAQTPTGSSDDLNEPINFEDDSFSPYDLWHRLRFMRKDPSVFQEEQTENLNSEILDFRTRQLEQLRQQQDPSASPELGLTNEGIEIEYEGIAPESLELVPAGGVSSERLEGETLETDLEVLEEVLETEPNAGTREDVDL